MSEADPDQGGGGDTIRILLVDDQELVRAGLRQIFGLEPDIEIVGEAGDGVDCLGYLDRIPIDVILMDVRMRGMDGVEATRAVRDRTGPPVLVLTTFDDDATLWGAIDAGAAGFVLKEAPGEDIVRATRLVAAGGSWLDPAVTARVLAASRQTAMQLAAATDGAGGLTPREREVLAVMATGASNTEIAVQLHVGQATVKSHVSAILTKLGARDRAAAIVFAFQHGLTQPGSSGAPGSR